MDPKTLKIKIALPPEDVLSTPEIYSPKKHDSTYAPKIELDGGKFSVCMVNGSLTDALWLLHRLDLLIARTIKNN
jgi:hypothetical protein